MFIGEAPGRKGADRTRIPFSGDQSGKNFERFLASIGLKRSEIFVTSAALCSGVALEALKLLHYHEFNLKDDVAKIRRWKERLLVPLYHPSPQVLITRRDERAQLRDYRVVKRAILRAQGF